MGGGDDVIHRYRRCVAICPPGRLGAEIVDILSSRWGLEEAADRSFAPVPATKWTPRPLDRSTAKNASLGEAVLKLSRSPGTPELHFYHRDRSAFGEGFSYGSARLRDLKRQIWRSGVVCGPCWPSGYCRIWQKRMSGSVTSNGVVGRNGHPGPCRFGLMQDSGFWLNLVIGHVLGLVPPKSCRSGPPL